MMNTTKNIDYQPKIGLIITPLIPISLLFLFCLFTGKFSLDLVYITSLFSGIYYILLFPVLLRICHILIAKNRFIFPIMWFGAHLSFSLLYFFLAIYENISHNQPLFEYVFPTVWHTFASTSTLTISFILSLIFWSFASFLPKLKAKEMKESAIDHAE